MAGMPSMEHGKNSAFLPFCFNSSLSAETR